jgi:uncharacterized protein
MIIDAFCHAIPSAYRSALEAMEKAGRVPPFSDFFRGELGVPGISNMDERWRLMDAHPETVQVVSLTGPFLETIAGASDAAELARVANDSMADLVARHPERFIAGIATISPNNVEAALIEIDRAVHDLGLRGIQIGTDIDGKPLDSAELLPIYEKMADLDLPIFIHPSRNYLAPDYPGESDSKYNLFSAIGWPHSTSMAMMRLAYGGILERFPTLKFITHHAGGTIPYLAKRVEMSDRRELPKLVGEYLRLFYGDTAVQGNVANLMCAQAFFGAEHIIFGTDFPFNRDISMALASVENMAVSVEDRRKIFSENAVRVLKLEPQPV